jgi:hypothetical protein
MSLRKRLVLAGMVIAVSVAAPMALAHGADGTVDRVVQDPAITESSGLATSIRHPGIVWTVNDSGDEPRLYAVDTNGATVAVLTVADVEARDWEAVAAVRGPDGVPTLWVGDIGDNTSSWESVRVLRIPEPAVLTSATVTAQRYELVYDDGPADAEALLADPGSGQLYIATKRASNPGMYALPAALSSDGTNVLSRVREVPPVVTDGAWNPVDGRFVLVGYVYAWLYADLGAEPEQLVLPPRPQGETVTWSADGRSVLVGSEGVGSTIWRVDVGGGRPSSTPAPGSADPTTSPGATAVVSPAASDGGRVAWWVWALGGAAVAVGAVVFARR